MDIHILTAPPGGDWVLFDTLITDKQGKIEYVIPEDQHLPEGMYPVKFVVRLVKTLFLSLTQACERNIRNMSLLSDDHVQFHL